MAKYEFDLSVGIKEVLDADSAKKVESQIEAQKKKFEEPIELKLSISDAKKRFSELEKETKKIQKSLDRALSTRNFDSISKYTKQMSNIQKEQNELLSIIGDQTKAITQQSDAIKTVETAEKRRKKTVDDITAATEDTVAVIKEQAKAIGEVAKAEAKLNKTRKTKKSKSNVAGITDVVDGAKEAQNALDSVEDKVEDVKDAYKSLNDIIDETKKKILGTDFDDIFSKRTVEDYADALTKVRNKMAEIKDEARDAKQAYEDINNTILSYTGAHLGNKTAFQKAIKDAWNSGDRAMAAKLFSGYQEKFPTGKYDPAKQFGAEWSKNFSKNLEEANRNLSYFRTQLKRAAVEYGTYIALVQLQTTEKTLEDGYNRMLEERVAAEKEAAKTANALAEAQKRFATDDITVAQKNLNAAIDEYNEKLEKSNKLLAEKRRLEDLESYENEPWYKEGELPANYIVENAKLFAEAEDAVNSYKITLKEAVRVYRELGGEMKLPFSDERLLKEIDIPVKVVPTVAKSKYYEIDEGAAKRAKEANSFSDYVPGSATRAYRQAVDELSAIVESKKKQFPDRAAELDRMLDTYAKRYAEYINKQNAIDASVPSVMIAGPAGIKQSQKDRQNQRREANYKFFQEKVEALENKIKEIGTGPQTIRTDDDHALEDLEKKVEDLKKAHQVMVEANKYFRKHKTLDGFEGLSEQMKKEVEQTRAAWGQPDMQPFPQYALQNSNAEIKRLEGRIKELKGLKDSEGLREINEFYSLITDKKDMRIRISFEMGKPDQEVIDMLKGKAFKWSPKNEAWQRQLTDNAVRDTKKLQESLHEYFKIDASSEEYANITKEVNTLSAAYDEMSQRASRSFKFSEEYVKTLDLVKKGALSAADAIKQLNEFIAANGLEAQSKMRETAKLIGELQTNYSDKFDSIFGETMNSFGALDTSNAAAMYDALIAKEQEYHNMVKERIKANEDFIQTNQALVQQYQESESFTKKYAELIENILNGNIGLEEANKQLQEFVSTLSEAVDKQKELFKAPKNNYEKLYNTLTLGENAFESKTKGDVSGFSWADRETIAEALVNGLQKGLKEINIVLNNGKTTLTFPGSVDVVSQMLDKLGFKAIESEITKFIGKAFKKGQDVRYADVDGKHWITNSISAYRLSRPLNEMEHGAFASYKEADMSNIVKIAERAVEALPENIREAIVPVPGKKSGDKVYIFKTEDGQYITVNKSNLDNLRKISSGIGIDPKGFGEDGVYRGFISGFGQDGSVVGVTMPMNQKFTDKEFSGYAPALKDFTSANNKALDIAGIKAANETIKELDTMSIGGKLLDLERVTNKSVAAILSDYNQLEDGIKAKVNPILQSLGLMDDQLRLTFDKAVGGNSIAILSKDFVILQKFIESSVEFSDKLINKLNEAKQMGVNVAPILERTFSTFADKSKSGDGKFIQGYEVQERATGNILHAEPKVSDLNKALEENKVILKSTDEQLIKFIQDWITLGRMGLQIDPSKGGNFLYSFENGFSFVDLTLQSAKTNAEDLQTIFNEITTMLANTKGFYAFSKDTDLGLSSSDIITRVASAFEQIGLASKDELNNWTIERFDGIGNIQKQLSSTEDAIKTNKKLESSYKGLAEAVQEFYDAHAKVRAKTDMDDEYWELSKIEEEKRKKVVSFVPQDTEAHYDAYASIAHLLNRRERKNAVPAANILKQIEQYIKKAETEISQSNLNETKELVERLQSTYGSDYDSIFGDIHSKFGKLNTGSSKSYYDALISKEKEYLEAVKNRTNAVEENKKLQSSYEGLAEAVERYVTSSKKLWEAYDKRQNFDQFADERNAAAAEISSMFPNKQITSGTSADTYFQSMEMSRMYASKGAEATLADIEDKLTQAKEEQVRLTQEAEVAALAQAEAEKKAAEEARKAAEAKEKQVTAANKVAKTLSGAGATDVSVEEIVAHDIEKALSQLRSAKNNETSLFSLKDVFDGDDLVSQAQAMISNIAEQANLKLGLFEVEDNIVKVQLYNEELKVLVNHTYQLKAATDEAEASLQLVGQKFKQNVKALNTNNFDSDSAQKLALSSIEKIRADAERAKYNLSALETQAKAISSSDDVTKFNAELKNAQNNIQAIKNSTATKSSMNPLINMQRDMKVANTELDTMQLKLDKLGNIDGVNKAAEIIANMRKALDKYNAATTSEGQQKAYNEYSNLRHSFKAQLEYINAAKALNDSQKSEEKKTDPIREQYQSILDLVNKINAKSTEITKYQSKDGGSGIFAGYIEQLQSEKARLVSELKGITDEINSTLGSGFIQGKEFSVPFASFLDDSGAISSFLNDTRTQASLTTEEIEKLVVALQKSQNIDVNAASKVVEQFKSVQETYKRLSGLTGLDKGNENYQALVGVFGQIMKYKESLSSDPTSWTPEEGSNLQTLIDQFTKYGNALADVGEKEARYFAGKQKYTEGTTYGSALQNVSEETKQLNDTRKQLEDAAKSFAKDSGAGDAFITGFTQSADGISRLDFSVFDSATGSLRNFRMEMGSVTEGMFVTETTVSKSLANIKAAQKQLESTGSLIGRLDASDVNVGEGNAPTQVARLLELYKQLSAEISKGDDADQNKIAKLTKDLKLASSETEKFYKQMLQMESAIASGQAKDLGIGDPKGDVYGQLVSKTKELVGTQQNATLEFGRFDKATNTLNASLVHANGTVENFQVQMNGLNGQMTAQQSGVTKLTTSWDRFKAGVGQAGKHLMTALVGYNAFFKVVSEVRKGIGYVKEIDLALTELKKVTNETEESYKKFLNTAAGTAGEIGSTVSDFTEASANFARLGYTMEESAEMAKTAIVYKNVADGLDTVEQSTESIISTMKAFGIESDDTMGIIDRFNEVGNNFAITSAGIGEALQRSASALYAGGNTIDESIALVTAANSVIQNPEQVGELIAQQYSNILLENSYIG